jgi:hypothetical protein
MKRGRGTPHSERERPERERTCADAAQSPHEAKTLARRQLPSEPFIYKRRRNSRAVEKERRCKSRPKSSAARCYERSFDNPTLALILPKADSGGVSSGGNFLSALRKRSALIEEYAAKLLSSLSLSLGRVMFRI